MKCRRFRRGRGSSSRHPTRTSAHNSREAAAWSMRRREPSDRPGSRSRAMNEQLHRHPFGHEGGAVIVQTALVMVVLLGFSAFVVDYGIFWVSRAQAQNAADAGALAGGLASAYDPLSAAFIIGASQAVAAQNAVWFEAPSSVV